MKKCKACREDIDQKATKCPKCGTDQRGFFKKHPIITGILVLFLIGMVGSSGSGSTPSSTKSESTDSTSNTTNKEPAPIQVEQKDNQDTPSIPSETVSQKNAVKKAKSYLNFTGFSRDGLVAQLEYEKFSHEDAVYGADNSGADWNEQAVKKAKSYNDFSAFSRGSLIEQLKYEKFTQEQAEYGATAIGL